MLEFNMQFLPETVNCHSSIQIHGCNGKRLNKSAFILGTCPGSPGIFHFLSSPKITSKMEEYVFYRFYHIWLIYYYWSESMVVFYLKGGKGDTVYQCWGESIELGNAVWSGRAPILSRFNSLVARWYDSNLHCITFKLTIVVWSQMNAIEPH